MRESPTRRVLFICTGNYYRSRYAEALFNHYADLGGLSWRAFSRGFSPHLTEGELSPFTLGQLTRLGIGRHHTSLWAQPLTEADLRAADRRIALKEAEHAPMLRDRFPAWLPTVEYWHVSDLDAAAPEEALPQIEQKVLGLIDEIRHADRTPSGPFPA
jgi:protein-tyrosine phosphatase